MILITAVVNSDDAGRVSRELTKNGFIATKLATTGGFLKVGNTTFLIGVDDGDVDRVIDILRNCSSRREQVMSVPMSGTDTPAIPVKVNVGGATVFVTDVERFEKL